MNVSAINQANVGRIAERIIANELEFRGFRVSDLNRDGTSANADLLAVSSKNIWQVQVKGATNTEKDRGWWVQYGHCNESVIAGREPMFNRVSSFYKADVVILVAVKSPKDYTCLVLPVAIAEKSSQINLDRDFRTSTAKGAPKKPHKMWIALDSIPNTKNASRRALFVEELEILKSYRDKWEILAPISASTADLLQRDSANSQGQQPTAVFDEPSGGNST
jgi:hypothetical protein